MVAGEIKMKTKVLEDLDDSQHSNKMHNSIIGNMKDSECKSVEAANQSTDRASHICE